MRPRRVARALTGVASAGVLVALVVGRAGIARVAPAVETVAGVAGTRTLELYHSAPVLVRVGEAVTIPVDVVCATASGKPCDASVTMRAGEGLLSAATAAAEAAPGTLRFDLSALVARAAADGTGSVPYALRADDGRGAIASVPAGGDALRVFVAPEMRALRVPGATDAEAPGGTTSLALPWGSGSMRAGLSHGPEAETLGPPAFDVDREGRIHLLDAVQGRVAVFESGRLVRETPVAVAPRSDIAMADDGTAYLLSPISGSTHLGVTRIERDGRVGGTTDVGQGILGEIRTAGDRPYVRLLPLDAWVPVGAPTPVSMGRPLAGGAELLRVVRDGSVSLGTVREGSVGDAVELRFGDAIGEIALAEPDGAGGYLAVVRSVGDGSASNPRFLAVHARADGTLRTFAMRLGEYAQAAPLSRFRLGPDGSLYQMTSDADGLRILRYGSEAWR